MPHPQARLRVPLAVVATENKAYKDLYCSLCVSRIIVLYGALDGIIHEESIALGSVSLIDVLFVSGF